MRDVIDPLLFEPHLDLDAVVLVADRGLDLGLGDLEVPTGSHCG